MTRALLILRCSYRLRCARRLLAAGRVRDADRMHTAVARDLGRLLVTALARS